MFKRSWVNITSPVWIGAPLTAALCFVLWAVWLMVSVSQLQTDTRYWVAQVSQLHGLEEIVRGLRAVEDGQPGDAAAARKRKLREDYAKSMHAIRLFAANDAEMAKQLERADSLVRQAMEDPTDRVYLGQVLDAFAAQVAVARGNLAEISRDLVFKWRQLAALAIVSCLLAILLALLGAVYRAELLKRAQAERALLEKSAELAATLTALPDLYFWTDLDGTIRRSHAGMLTFVPPEKFLNQRLQEVLPTDVRRQLDDAINRVVAGAPSAEIGYPLPGADGLHWFEARLLKPLENQILVIVRDTTVRTSAEQEKATAIKRLQAALDEIKTLRGLVPICANCKSIRDDHGSWHQLEVYLLAHTEARFTHGICPGCLETQTSGLG